MCDMIRIVVLVDIVTIQKKSSLEHLQRLSLRFNRKFYALTSVVHRAVARPIFISPILDVLL
jgi:hypothetical protein